MKIQAKINLICATESGVSKSTGKPWASRWIVCEMAEDGLSPSTMALRVFNEDVIRMLDKCKEGDIINMDVHTTADYREFTRADGTKWSTRSTDCVLRNMEVVRVSGF